MAQALITWHSTWHSARHGLLHIPPWHMAHAAPITAPQRGSQIQCCRIDGGSGHEVRHNESPSACIIPVRGSSVLATTILETAGAADVVHSDRVVFACMCDGFNPHGLAVDIATVWPYERVALLGPDLRSGPGAWRACRGEVP